MLTPQDITEKGFNKVLVNGYDMGEVDDFLETVTEDYSALYKENAILKGKLKVLVEKVEEYRTTEDAMRMALLTAQRMGDEITSDATKTRDEMIAGTEKKIKERLAESEKRIADEEMRLVAASNETAKFLELSQAILRKHSEFLKKLELAQRTVKVRKPSAGNNPNDATKNNIKPSLAAQQNSKPQKIKQSAPPAPSPAPVQRSESVQKEVNIEFDSIAEEIGNAVEEIAQKGPEIDISGHQDSPTINTSNTSGDVLEHQKSLFSDEDSLKLFSPENEEKEKQSPRPKFDFDDLKFGANFDTED